MSRYCVCMWDNQLDEREAYIQQKQQQWLQRQRASRDECQKEEKGKIIDIFSDLNSWVHKKAEGTQALTTEIAELIKNVYI